MTRRTLLSGHHLAGEAGALAAVVVEPADRAAVRFGVLYLPPFADEMNKSRRMAALQARALAAAGGCVVMLDPRGTGDSDGDHGGATWPGWQADAGTAWRWLGERAPGPRVLWGLRLGALLGADLVAHGHVKPAALVLWQPVVNGRTFVHQFLRLATIQSRIGGDGAGVEVKALRQALAAGQPVEVGGYAVTAGLTAPVEALELAALDVGAVPVVWRDVDAGAEPSLAPASTSVLERWRGRGIAADAAAVGGPSFWIAQEIAEAPALVASTTVAIERDLAAHSLPA